MVALEDSKFVLSGISAGTVETPDDPQITDKWMDSLGSVATCTYLDHIRVLSCWNQLTFSYCVHSH